MTEGATPANKEAREGVASSPEILLPPLPGLLTYPSRIVSSTEGGAPVTCTIRDVKINPELPDELFRLPENNG